MLWRRGIGLVSSLLALCASLADATQASRGVVRLRALEPKAVYRPGETIAFEIRCGPGVTGDVLVLYNPGEGSEGGLDNPLQKCPYSRFRLTIPDDFVGKSSVSVLMRHAGAAHADMFDFEVRSDRKPKELWMWDLTSSSEAPFGNDACPPLSFYPDHSIDQPLSIYALMTDGTRLDICGEGVAVIRTDPAADFPFSIKNGACVVTPRRAGSFRVTASFNGLTKSWGCTVEEDDFLSQQREVPRPAPAAQETGSVAPRVPPKPGAAMTVAEFLATPMKLRGHPTDVGSCRLVEHWETGYCYIFSMGRGKVSEYTDVRCGELPELRRRMKTAIQAGHCGDREAARRTQTGPELGSDAYPRREAKSTLGRTLPPLVESTIRDIRTLAIAVEAYGVDNPEYPVASDVRTLARAVEPKYIAKAPRVDAWGTTFAFVSNGKTYRIVSAGSDRTFETDSTALDGTAAGRTGNAARDIVFSNGRFLQRPE